MSRRRPGVRASTLAAVAALACLVAGCAQVPHDGPVVDVQEQPQLAAPAGQYYRPKGPQPGDSAADVVTGFLVAMTATPLETRTAREFLTTAAQQRWKPQRLVTYRNRTQDPGPGHVAVRLEGADQVGSRGQWMGSVGGDAARVDFPVARENGEWRITSAPDALIVPRTFYDEEYQEAEVYFFDPSGRILVPEPVHVPEGSQLATGLVRSLVRGPGPSLRRVAHSYLPLGLSPVVSVPVSDSGVADVTLKGPDPGPLTRKTTQLILAQLSWTLRQDPTITGFRLSVSGRQVADQTGAQFFRIRRDATDPHDPAVSLASSQFYALRAGRLVSGQLERPTPVDGPFGDQDLGLGEFSVSLNGDEAAGVAARRLLVGPVAGPAPATEVLTGDGLLRPAWDFAHRLWEIRSDASGAAVFWMRKGQVHTVRMPGITGASVHRFLVSRDGSRLVAVLRGKTRDRIVVSRIQYDADDRPVRGTRARPVPWVSTGAPRIRDIGWSTPTTLEVLDQFSQRQSEARILNVDGSTAADEAPTTTIPGRAIALATSPAGGTQPYAVLRNHSLYDLAQVDATPPSVGAVPTPGLWHVTYAG
jgi:Lipoprotein LpqB beta-propeller domain/Sporulation and spore germination